MAGTCRSPSCATAALAESFPAPGYRVNGRDVGTLGAGEKITIYVAPGRVVFGVGAWSSERRFAERIVAGAPQRFRITLTADNRFILTRATGTAR